MQSEMQLLSQWANIPAEDYVTLLTPPIGDSKKVAEHFSRVETVYLSSFQEVLRIWSKLPVGQWETVKAIGRDMPEWQDLREALITFRKALRKVRRIPKKVKNEAIEGQSPEVS